MREKFSTVTVGGSTFEVCARPACADVWEMYRQHPDWTIEHERCDDASCKICRRMFGDKEYRRMVNDGD